MKHFLLLSLFTTLFASHTYSAQMSRVNAQQALFNAIADNQPQKVSQILQAHPYIQASMSDDRNFTPLMYTSILGHTEVAQILIKYHADINETQRDGEQTTALMYAVKHHHPAMVKLLLEHGANTEIHQVSQNFYRSPLIRAIQNKNKEIIKILLEHGALINITDIMRKTPLRYAIETNQPEIVTLLIEYGATPDTQVLWYAPSDTNVLGYKPEPSPIHLSLSKAIQKGVERRKEFLARKKAAEDLVHEYLPPVLSPLITEYAFARPCDLQESNNQINNNDSNPQK